jgi:lysine 2,3-aminomutase
LQEDYLGAAVPEALRAVENAYPVQVNTGYLDLIDRRDPFRDPIGRQCLPHPDELLDYDASFDPFREEASSPAPRLVRRYHDRAVLLATGRCPSWCRFCFRKRLWRAGGSAPGDLTDQELETAASWLETHPEVKEVLITGGDPLMLSNRRLREIIARLRAVPSLEVLRLGTRIPVTWPERIDDELAALLGETPGLWVVTHFNHPRELREAAVAACTRLAHAGVPLLNQTVLLKGVNDDAAVLEELFRGLVRHRIKPHYLFHVDPVCGVRHFATGIACGKAILRTFRPRLSSLAVPTFAIDLPEGGGKVHLQEDYRCGDGFEKLDGAPVIYPEALANPTVKP